MRVKQVELCNINIGIRFREQMGITQDFLDSIKEKGLIQPITVDESLNLIAGGRRLAACRKLGFQTIPAIIRKVEDEIDAREIELLENRERKNMTWQEDMNLTAEIHRLMQNKHGDSYWSQSSTAKLIGKSRSAVQDALELSEAMKHVPEIAEAPTADSARKTFKRLIETAVVNEAVQEVVEKEQAKNVKWASDHYVVGDVRKRIGAIADGVMNFAEVDPPYGIDLKEKRKNKGEHLDKYNEVDKKDYPNFIEFVAKQVYRVLADNSFCVWWYGPTWHDQIRDILTKVGFTIDPIPAIWYKPTGGVTNNPDEFLARQYEPFFICKKGKPLIRSRGKGNVFPFMGVPPSQRIHSTERPVELIQTILTTLVYPGARVIVPFLGSGNTLIACYKEGMTGFGYDLSQETKDAFLVRMAKEFPDEINLEEQKM